ncbi:unnamed protein product [Sphagnum jensenii]
MGSRATEKMRSEMMQAREKGLTLVKVAFHMTALIMLNIHSGELNDKIKDMYILIKGMFFLTIDLPWTAYGKGMRVRTDD